MSTTIAKLKKNRILHTSKIGNLLPDCLRNNRHLADHISLSTKTEICTSLKSEFYFLFRLPSSTKSMLISYISIQVLVTIRGKICPPQSQNCQIRIFHISKIGNLLPVCPRNNSVRNNHISERRAKFGENRGRNRSTTDRWTIELRSIKCNLETAKIRQIHRILPPQFTDLCVCLMSLNSI